MAEMAKLLPLMPLLPTQKFTWHSWHSWHNCQTAALPVPQVNAASRMPRLSLQDRNQAGILPLKSKDLALCWISQVAVDQDHALALLRKRERNIECDRGLALAV